MENTNKNTIEAIKNDIVSLRGTEVKIFGQPTTLDAEVGDLTIDILDVLDNLKPYEVEAIEVSEPCEHCQGTGIVYKWDDEEECELEEECEECDGDGIIYNEINAIDALEKMYDLGDLEEMKCDNSYNWGSPVSNHFDYRMYKDLNTNKIYVEFKVHRYGDVRCNYTDAVVLEFDNDYEFLESMLECNKNIEVDNFDCELNIFSDTMEVYTKDGDYKGNVCVYSMEELKEEVSNL